MAILEIPVRGDLESYSFQADLDGRTYTLKFDWNVRSNRWTFTIRDTEGVDLLSGLSLVAEFSLLKKYVKDELPPGTFFVLDTSGLQEEPTQEGFGGRWRVLYEEAT